MTVVKKCLKYGLLLTVGYVLAMAWIVGAFQMTEHQRMENIHAREIRSNR